MVDHDDDHELTTFFGILPLNVDISDSKMLEVVRMTFSNVFITLKSQ